jgi:chromosome partitioning protein
MQISICQCQSEGPLKIKVRELALELTRARKALSGLALSVIVQLGPSVAGGSPSHCKHDCTIAFGSSQVYVIGRPGNETEIPVKKGSRPMPKAKVLAFINYKGGVAKTTTTYHVGCSLVQHWSKRVLLLDIDPQTNLTFLCASIQDWEKFKKDKGTIASMYRRYLEGKPLDTKRFIWREPVGASIKRRIQGLDLIPCDIDLIGEDLGGGDLAGPVPGFELLKRHAGKYIHDRSFLRKALREVEDDYDYVLIDCPPNLYLMTQNALVASRWYVVTAIPDHLSTIGLSILQQKVRKIGESFKSAHTLAGNEAVSMHTAEMGGVIFVRVRLGGTMITNVHLSTMIQVGKSLGNGVCFGHHTTELIGYGEAAEQSLPVWMTRTRNAAAAAAKAEYESITEEFVKRY